MFSKSVEKKPSQPPADLLRMLKWSQVAEALEGLEMGARDSRRDRIGPLTGTGLSMTTAGYRHRTANVSEAIVGPVTMRHLEDSRLALWLAFDLDGSIIASPETVTDIRLEGSLVETVER